MKFNLFGKKRSPFEKYKEETFKVLDGMKKGPYGSHEGCDRLVRLREDIYAYAKGHCDEDCLKLWRVISRIGYSFVSEQHQHCGRIAEEEIYFRNRINFVLNTGIKQIDLSSGNQLEEEVEKTTAQEIFDSEEIYSGVNGHGRKRE